MTKYLTSEERKRLWQAHEVELEEALIAWVIDPSSENTLRLRNAAISYLGLRP